LTDLHKIWHNDSSTTHTQSLHVIVSLYIYPPHPSQSKCRLYNHWSTHLPCSGWLMAVLLLLMVCHPVRKSKCSYACQKFHIFLTCKNPGHLTFQTEFCGTPKLRSFKPMKLWARSWISVPTNTCRNSITAFIWRQNLRRFPLHYSNAQGEHPSRTIHQTAGGVVVACIKLSSHKANGVKEHVGSPHSVVLLSNSTSTGNTHDACYISSHFTQQ
jgi:hypothetical protein